MYAKAGNLKFTSKMPTRVHRKQKQALNTKTKIGFFMASMATCVGI